MRYKIVFAAMALVFVAAACNRTGNQNEQNNESEVVSPQTVVIKMTANGFEPSQVTVAKGTRVNFVNEDSRNRWPASAPHPTHTDYPEFDPKKGLAAGESWSFTFDKVGNWRFHDHLIPSAPNFGSVTVTE